MANPESRDWLALHHIEIPGSRALLAPRNDELGVDMTSGGYDAGATPTLF